MAGELFLSRYTIKSEVNTIRRKLGASSGSEAVVRAGILACLTGKEPGLCPFPPMGGCRGRGGAGIVREQDGTGIRSRRFRRHKGSDDVGNGSASPACGSRANLTAWHQTRRP